MRFLLDTNIISNITKAAPSEALLAWMSRQVDDDLFITSLTIAETWRGVLEKPAGRRRDQLEAWFVGPEGPQALFMGRILPFDQAAGLIWARLMAEGKVNGRPRSAFDMMIAAVAEANGCIVVTDNERDFEGIEIINPLRVPRLSAGPFLRSDTLTWHCAKEPARTNFAQSADCGCFRSK